MANKIISTRQVGNAYQVVFDHTGPASYLNVSTNAGAGDVINAKDLGFGGFENIGFMGNGISQDGLAAAQLYPTLIGQGNAVPSVQARWFTYPAAATTGALGAEIANTTNLSGVGKTVRMVAICV
jgi:hypothetical protein